MIRGRLVPPLCSLLFIVLLTVPVHAQVSPHDHDNGVTCTDCHYITNEDGVLRMNVPRGTAQEAICKTCHNPDGLAAGMSSVGNHQVKGGTTIIECTTCHDPHVSQKSTDPHTGTTADNLSLVRSTIAPSRIPGVQNPVVYQQPSQLIFTDAPYSGVCQGCHTATSYHRNDGSVDRDHQADMDCLTCHTHGAGFSGSLDHVAAGAVLPIPGCMNCHGDGGSDPVVSVHNADCGLCHLNPSGGGPMIEPYETIAPSGGDCTACHGTMAEIHQGANHTATPGSGPVVIFADDDHDDAGWIGARPYFDVQVDCDLCHTSDLPAAHGQQCDTCHPSPRDTLGTWSGGCSAGACHQTIHEGSIPAHWPYADTFDPENDCNRCHQPSWTVEQTSCLYCHAPYGSGDVTPPATTFDAQATYLGPALIDFVVTDGGKVGVGTTFYRLDGGEALTGSKAPVNTPGPHTLQFWSMDQSGNLEAPPTEVTFTIIEDTTPPTTTSNAYSSYYNGATITLTATDTSSLGARTTYYTLNGGPVQTGTVVSVPAVSGVISYQLVFWSEDWSGNVEPPKSASFTVTSGTATLRLVWGDSDTGSPPSHPDDSAYWYIRRGGPSGYLVASGSGANPGWSGVNDVIVPVSPTPYFVDIWWWDSYYGWDDNTVFPSVLADTPGEIIRLSY